MLALRSGAHVVIQHISSGRSVELVRIFKSLGANLHAEATPHHFTLTDEAVLKYGTLAKMNPPLRKEEDRQAIIEGLADGTIDLIATDHAPHSKEEKDRSITAAPSGITGLETSLPLGITCTGAPGTPLPDAAPGKNDGRPCRPLSPPRREDHRRRPCRPGDF